MYDRAKAAHIIASAILDYQIRHNGAVMACKCQLMMVSHFAKQGVKVRMK
jgi:hypothetical protein